MAIEQDVRAAAQKLLLFLPHAIRQMVRPERMITSNEVQAVVTQGELIEDYPSDPRGHSYLMLGFGETGRPVHMVCVRRRNQYLAIITAYLPDPGQWSEIFDRGARKWNAFIAKGG